MASVWECSRNDVFEGVGGGGDCRFGLFDRFGLPRSHRCGTSADALYAFGCLHGANGLAGHAAGLNHLGLARA